MLASAIVLGVVLGRAFGGDWRRLTRLEVRWGALLIPAALVRALGFLVVLPVTFYLFALTLFGLVATANFRLPGAPLVATGIWMNVLVIAANGGMPVSAEAAASAGFRLTIDGLHIPLESATQLSLLADVIPVAVFRNVYSAGDVLLALGGFWMPFALLRGK